LAELETDRRRESENIEKIFRLTIEHRAKWMLEHWSTGMVVIKSIFSSRQCSTSRNSL
jgi:hypothetical protein